MFYMKTVSVRMYTFHNCENYVKVRITARLSGTDLVLRLLLCSKVPVISRFLKYKLCPPPFVSRVLLSWQLVYPYLYESNSTVNHLKFVWMYGVGLYVYTHRAVTDACIDQIGHTE